VFDLPTVVLLTRDPELATLAKASIWEAGAAVHHLEWPEQLDAVPVAPRLLACGHDIGSDVVPAVRGIWPSCAVVRVAVGDQHEGGPAGDLVLPGAWRRLTARVEEAHAAPRTARRIALIGAHGGAGTSCLAVALARQLRAVGRVRLAAVNPVGAPVGALLGLDGPPVWAEAVAEAEDGEPVRRRDAAGVELLSPAGPEEGLAAWQILKTVEAWEEDGHTVFDAARGAPCGGWRCAVWADVTVIVARADPAGISAARTLADELAALGLEFGVAVREVRGGVKAQVVGERLGRPDVIRVGRERSLAAGLAHGMTPGDRAVGPLATAARALARLVQVPEAGARGARPASGHARSAAPELWDPVGRRAAWDVAPVGSSMEAAQNVNWDPAPAGGCEAFAPPSPRFGTPGERNVDEGFRASPRQYRGEAENFVGPSRHRRPRTRRPALPAFNPAAFAEEW
jgi:hypothetical protein